MTDPKSSASAAPPPPPPSPSEGNAPGTTSTLPKQEQHKPKATAIVPKVENDDEDENDDDLKPTDSEESIQVTSYTKVVPAAKIAPSLPITSTSSSVSKETVVSLEGAAPSQIGGKAAGLDAGLSAVTNKQNPSAFLPSSSALPSLLSQPQFSNQMASTSSSVGRPNNMDTSGSSLGAASSQMPQQSSMMQGSSSAQVPEVSSSAVDDDDDDDELDRDESSVVQTGTPRQYGQQNFFQQCRPFPPLEQPGSRILSADYLTSVINLADFIGKFGLIFWTVRTDIHRNALIVQEFYWKNTAACKYLDELINRAKATKSSGGWFSSWRTGSNSSASTLDVASRPKMTPVVEGLIWTHRTIAFFAHVLRSLAQEREALAQQRNAPQQKQQQRNQRNHRGQQQQLSEDLRPYFRDAWRDEIEPAATWLMKMLFEVVMSGAPNRSHFLRAMAGTGTYQLNDQQLYEQLDIYMRSLEACCNALKQCFIQHGYEP